MLCAGGHAELRSVGALHIRRQLVRLEGQCPEQLIETTDMVRLSKKFQTAKNSVDLVCDSGRYRHDEVEMLADRLSSLKTCFR